MCNNKRQVKCIEGSGSCIGNRVITGQVYNVKNASDKMYHIEDSNGKSHGWWYMTRFEDVTNIKDYVCVDNSESAGILTVGKTYRLQPSRFSGAKFLEPADGDCFDDGAKTGGMYAHRFVLAEDYCAPATEVEKDNNGEFIVWSPDSSAAPKLRYYSYKQARFVARQMVEKHGGEFIVFRAEARYTKTCEVNKEEL